MRWPATSEGDPVVTEFYHDLASYPIMLNTYMPYRIVETTVRKEHDAQSPTGYSIYIWHRVEPA